MRVPAFGSEVTKVVQWLSEMHKALQATPDQYRTELNKWGKSITTAVDSNRSKIAQKLSQIPSDIGKGLERALVPINQTIHQTSQNVTKHSDAISQRICQTLQKDIQTLHSISKQNDKRSYLRTRAHSVL